MSALIAARAALLVVALLALRRARGPRGTALAGLAGAAAALGPGPVPVPGPALLGAGLLAAALAFALLRADVHPPLAGEALRETAGLAAGAAAAAGVAFRGAGPAATLLAVAALVAGLSLLGAEGSRANAEAGWRRGAAWAGAVVLPALAGSGLAAAASGLPARYVAAGPAAGLLVALLAWAAPFLLERRRVQRELSEEAGLGILPVEDLAVLGSPWRRAREARFGRADERREYVRSALLLAVARQQQRRRSGEAIRLRQLEVLAFRTRVRRAVEGRAARYAPIPDELAV